MDSKTSEIFEDRNLVETIRVKLPRLFTIAELESSRAGKIGMEAKRYGKQRKSQRRAMQTLR